MGFKREHRLVGTTPKFCKAIMNASGFETLGYIFGLALTMVGILDVCRVVR
jgi:hypothetical protein